MEEQSENPVPWASVAAQLQCTVRRRSACNFNGESTWLYGRGEHRDGTGEESVAVSAGDVSA